MNDSFVWHKEWSDTVKGFPDEVRLMFYEAVMKYAFKGEIVDINKIVAPIFGVAKVVLERDIDIRRKRSEAGRMGGAPMGNTNARKSPSKSAKKKKKPVNPLISKGRKLFEKKYASLFGGEEYYWLVKDAVAMDSLTKKIIFSRKRRNKSIKEEDILSALEAFLDSVKDPWLLKNFSVTNINSKYNEIVAQAKAALKNNNNGVNSSTKESRAEDAAQIIARLAAKEKNDGGPLWQ